MELVLKRERKSSTQETTSHRGVYLAFALGDIEYGIDILPVRKIIGIMNLIPLPFGGRYINSNAYPYYPLRAVVPKNDSYLKGILQFRGQQIPLIDLRSKLGLREVAYTIETCIIIVKTGHKLKGVIVDKILDVFDMESTEIETMRFFEKKVDTKVYRGMVNVKDTARILLNIEKILDMKEINKELKKIKATGFKRMLYCK